MTSVQSCHQNVKRRAIGTESAVSDTVFGMAWLQPSLSIYIFIYDLFNCAVSSLHYRPPPPKKTTKNKLRSFSLQANYTDGATAACRQS
jgi:hypothetical protein